MSVSLATCKSRVVLAAARTTALLIALVLMSADVAGATTPTKAQFIRQGDALCTKTQQELLPIRRQAEAAKSLPASQKWAAATRVWTLQLQIQARFNARFRAIGTPPGDDVARNLTGGFDRGLLLARRVRNAFAARSTNALASALPTYLRFTISLNRRVASYGFHVCGR